MTLPDILTVLSGLGNVSTVVLAVIAVKLEFRLQRLEVHTGLRKVREIG